MPEEDGYELIRSVRTTEAERGARGRIPAVALTAYASSEHRVRALVAGFQMHVPKPVEPVGWAAVAAAARRAHMESSICALGNSRRKENSIERRDSRH